MSGRGGPQDLRLVAIAHLTRVVFDAAKVRMTTATAEVQRLTQQIAELDQSLSHRLMNVTLDPARIAGADIKWQVWVESRRRQLIAELARARGRQEDARAGIQVAFGKNSVAEELLSGAARRR